MTTGQPGMTLEALEREKERLKLKRVRALKQHQGGYIEDDEFQAEMAAVELALRKLDAPEVDGVQFEDVVEAGEHIPGIAALWDEATLEERREIVMLLLEPGGLYYDLELKIIAAIKPKPAFAPVLHLLNGVIRFDEAKGLFIPGYWRDRSQRTPDILSSLVPADALFSTKEHDSSINNSITGPRSRKTPWPKAQNEWWKIPPTEWDAVLCRVEAGESYRHIAKDYAVSYEAVRRVIQAARGRNC
jgi:hypothetical protein